MEEDDDYVFGVSKLLFEDDEEDKKNYNLNDNEEFLRPSEIIFDEETKEFLPQKKIKEESPEVRLIKLSREQPEEDYLFSGTKLIYDDEPDDIQEEDEYLFKPIDLIYDDDPLETFNKKREQRNNINPLKPLDLNNRITIDNKELTKKENKEIEKKEEPKIDLKKEEIKNEPKNENEVKNIEKRPEQKNTKNKKHFIEIMIETIEKNTNEIMKEKSKKKKMKKTMKYHYLALQN